MIDLTIRKPQCGDRPCYLRCEGNIPQKVKGRTLLPGKRYCAGGKRIKPFRSSDPKIRIPSWCPLRKAPAELRIYCVKSVFSWELIRMLRLDGIEYFPCETDYALRYEGTTDVTAAQFQQELREKSADNILNTPVYMDEIVEIDDGLTPYCFYFSEERPMPYVIRFSGAAARKNLLKTRQENPDDSKENE